MRSHSPPINSVVLTNRLLAEDLVPFAAVAQKMRVHISAPHRWRRRKPPCPALEAIRVLGKWMTSWQAVDRFVSALNNPPNPPTPPATAGGRPSAVIERQLDAEGL